MAPRKQNLKLKKDLNQNYEMIVDVINPDKKPEFYLIDITTVFQTKQFFYSIVFVHNICQVLR